VAPVTSAVLPVRSLVAVGIDCHAPIFDSSPALMVENLLLDLGLMVTRRWCLRHHDQLWRWLGSAR
jgi:hypothetical protein